MVILGKSAKFANTPPVSYKHTSLYQNFFFWNVEWTKMQNLKLSLQLVTRVERLISDKLNDAENGAWKVKGSRFVSIKILKLTWKIMKF